MWPRWCMNTNRSDTIQHKEEASPMDVMAAIIEIRMGVTILSLIVYVTNMSPTKKHITALTSNTRGDRLIHVSTHQGTL